MKKKRKNLLTNPVNEIFQSKDSPDEGMKQKLILDVIEAIEVRRKLIRPKSFKAEGTLKKN